MGHFQLGPWLIRPSLNTAVRNGTTNRLTPKAMAVLVCLAEHAGEPVPKEKLLEQVWPETFVSDDVLKGSIAEIRRVLEDDAKEPRIIETIAKRGYRMIAPVEWIDGEQQAPAAQLEPKANEIAAAPSRRSWMPWTVAAVLVVLIALAAIFDVGGLRTGLRANAAPQIRSLAVLPLQNLSADPAQEYFSDGMTDALITDLAQIGSLKVISRTSSMQYRNTKKSLPEIARELNVDGIVEGTVQRSGDRVRISAQLIQGIADKHIWANSYERDLRDVFVLERDVTDDIARQIQARLGTSNQPPPVASRPVNPKALEAYLEGNYHLDRFGMGSGDEADRKAADYFQQAIDEDPNFTRAYLGLARAHSDLLQGSSQDTAIRRRAVEAALRLDPNLSEARAASGDMKLYDWDWPGAEQEYRRAVALSPSNVEGHDGLCDLFDKLGRLDEGLAECQIAQQLDPTEDHFSDHLYSSREYDRTIELIRMLLKTHPDRVDYHYALYACYAAKGFNNESVQELEQVSKLIGLFELAEDIHRGFATGGYRRAIEAYARGLELGAATHAIFPPIELAQAYAALGNKDRAFYWLEQAYQNRDVPTAYINLTNIKMDPMLDPLRSDPRFKDLLRRVGLPQ